VPRELNIPFQGIIQHTEEARNVNGELLIFINEARGYGYGHIRASGRVAYQTIT